MNTKPNLKLIVLISVSAALGGFLFGYDTAVINGAIDALQGHFQLNDLWKGLSVSLALVGAAIGAFTAGGIADRIGRTRTMVIAAILFALSAIGSGIPFTLELFIFWRVLGGLGVGAASVIVPAYIAEIAPADLRGRLGSIQQLAIVIGIFAALLVDYAIVRLAGGSATTPWLLGFEGWRWMFWSELPPAVVYGIAALMIPESPRYLVAQGELGRAMDILRHVEADRAGECMAEIQETLKEKRPSHWSDLWGGVLGLKTVVWIGILLAFFQQTVGINVVFYYSSAIWRSVGYAESQSMLITVITSVVNIATTLVAIATIDRFGRKPLLLIGSLGMAAMLGLLSYCFFHATSLGGDSISLPQQYGIPAIVAFNAYVVFFGCSWGPIVWVLLGEMFNNRMRALAMALATATNWFANFAISTTFPMMEKTLGLGESFLVYAGFALL